jgi:Ca-activated chloride channel homolog
MGAGQPLTIAGAHLCGPLSADCRASLSNIDQAPTFTLRKSVDEVRVEFSVTDKLGHHIGSLSKADVQFSDNGTRINEVTDFRQESDLPIQVAILIDSSRSTEHELPVEKELALEFLRNLLRPQDRAMIANFNTHLNLPSSFTNRFDQLEDSVRAMRSEGLTALNDSLYELTSKDFNQTTSARKVVVVITDGHDSVSQRTFTSALDSVLRHDVTVYTVSILDKKSLDPDSCLARLTTETGGHSYVLKNLKKLKSAFDQIDADLRTYYVAAYRAPEHDNSAFHAVNVQVATSGLHVQNRKGYFRSE